MNSSGGVASSLVKRTARCGRLLPLRSALALLLLASTAWAAAQADLYGPDAPRDAAYLRFINAHSEQVQPAVDGAGFEPVEFAEVTPYAQLQPGDHVVTVGNRSMEFEARPESFTTIALLANEEIVFDDTPLRDISRGLLTLYNLRPEGSLTLRTADGTEVFASVPARESQSRVIAQAEVGLVVELAGGEALSALEPRLLERGTAHSLIVLPAGTEPQVVYARAGARR